MREKERRVRRMKIKKNKMRNTEEWNERSTNNANKINAIGNGIRYIRNEIIKQESERSKRDPLFNAKKSHKTSGR